MNRIESEAVLKTLLQNINGLNPLTIYRKHLLGELSLGDWEFLHKDLKIKLEAVILSLQDISMSVINLMITTASQYVELANKLSKLETQNFVNQREETYQSFNNISENLKEIWQQVAAVINLNEQKINNEDLIEDVLSQREKLKNDLNEVQQLKNSIEQQTEDFKEKNSQLFSKLEILTQSDIFKNEAENNERNSYWWLAGAVLSGIIFVLFICHIKDNFCFDINCYKATNLVEYNKICIDCGEHVLWYELLKGIVFRFLLISMNIYLISFCVRNYNACMHNKTINSHRHNSFSSAFHFYNNTTSSNKDEILAKAADAIFTYQKTGYYGKEGEPKNPSIIQNIAEKISGKE